MKRKSAESTTVRQQGGAKNAEASEAPAYPPGPSVTISNTGYVSLDYPEKEGRALLMKAMGTVDPSFFNGIWNQFSQLYFRGLEGHRRGEFMQNANFALSVIAGIKPKDQTEAMLALQMAAVHMATITEARRQSASGDDPTALSKLAKTYAAQMETLKRVRTSGEQKITVQYVTVKDGSQAIVGDVTQMQSRTPDRAASTTPLLTQNASTPMPKINPKTEAELVAVSAGRSRKASKK